MKKPQISLCMIVRNEAAHLEECLLAAKEYVDEIVVIDTGSTDNTIEVARKYASIVDSLNWSGDFSEMRNYAISKARGKWILYLDADEVIHGEALSLRELIKSNKSIDAYFLPLINYSDDNRTMGNEFLVLRLFKNNGNYKFKGKIHEQIIITDPQKVAIAESPEIYHKPLTLKARNHKRNRNLALLKQAIFEEPDNPFYNYYLGLEWLILGKPLKALPYFKYAYANLPDESLLFKGPAVKYLSLCYKFLGQFNEALVVCMEGSVKYPQYTDLLFLGGCILEEMEEWTISIKWFKEAINNGPSPAVYSRLEGSNSYLAYYHLGYCQEKLKLYQNAIESYEKAIKTNQDYYYPLFNLFLILITTKGPQETYDYFIKNISFTNTDTIFIFGELFFKAGYPDWADKFINAFPTCSNENLFLSSIKYQLFSGNTEGSLNLITQIKTDNEIIPLYAGIAKFLTGDMVGIRSDIVKLWKEQATRPMAWLLISLQKALSNTDKFPYKNVLPIAQNIFIESMKFAPSKNISRRILESMEIFIKHLHLIILKSDCKNAVSLSSIYGDMLVETIDSFNTIYPGGVEISAYE